jgi:hypothetical protein
MHKKRAIYLNVDGSPQEPISETSGASGVHEVVHTIYVEPVVYVVGIEHALTSDGGSLPTGIFEFAKDVWSVLHNNTLSSTLRRSRVTIERYETYEVEESGFLRMAKILYEAVPTAYV